MKLVFVHGRNQQGRDPETLRQEWTDSLRAGLTGIGKTLPASLQIEFPHYGDALIEIVKASRMPVGADAIRRGEGGSAQEFAFIQEAADELMKTSRLSDEEVEAQFGADVKERGVQNWKWVQAILRALDKKGYGPDFLEAFLTDVFVYLTYRSAQDKIEAIVERGIGDVPSVIVAHSLGSVVAYNILYDRPKSRDSVSLVTIGSPLGLDAVAKRVKVPLRMPPCLWQWFNAFDPRDVVALNPLDESHFPVEPPIKNFNGVANNVANSHGIDGYLRDPRVAEAIYAGLTSG